MLLMLLTGCFRSVINELTVLYKIFDLHRVMVLFYAYIKKGFWGYFSQL
jgi:hypothetical protein